MSAIAGVPFRFDAEGHVYTINDEPRPSITQMLDKTGWIDDRYYTAASAERGHQIHQLTADYDTGALDINGYMGRYRGWLLAHQAAMILLRPTILAVEEPCMHPLYRFGGRPDRVWNLRQMRTVAEIKSGAIEKSHQIQTALQAILLAGQGGLPAESYQRLAAYYKETGRYRLETHADKRDFDEAYRIIKVCCL
jgi:hypothetical protein